MENLKDKVLNWLATGEVGASSECMAFTSVGMPTRSDYPHDPDDFNRCLKLVTAIPEIKNHFPTVASLNEYWKAIIDNWDEIEKSFIDEVGFDWSKADSAPRTYKLMRGLLDPIRFKNSVSV